MIATPSFSGLHAAVLHRSDWGIERLMSQLELLGLAITRQWAPLDLAANPVDLVFVDADQGWDGLLPWKNGEAPVPVVALLGSEAPGRIAWAMEQGAGALISKPVVASAVYPALVMAGSVHVERQAVRARIAHLEERLKLRPIVHGAMRAVMLAQNVDEETAYGWIRDAAMRRRLAIEHVAAAIVTGQEPLSEAI